MSMEFKVYRRHARQAVNDLLRHKGKDTVLYYRNKINLATTEAEVSRVLVEVRENL